MERGFYKDVTSQIDVTLLVLPSWKLQCAYEDKPTYLFQLCPPPDSMKTLLNEAESDDDEDPVISFNCVCEDASERRFHEDNLFTCSKSIAESDDDDDDDDADDDDAEDDDPNYDVRP